VYSLFIEFLTTYDKLERRYKMNGFENAWKKINDYQNNRPKVLCCVGPTGPTGPANGPTGPTVPQ